MTKDGRRKLDHIFCITDTKINISSFMTEELPFRLIILVFKCKQMKYSTILKYVQHKRICFLETFPTPTLRWDTGAICRTYIFWCYFGKWWQHSNTSTQVCLECLQSSAEKSSREQSPFQPLVVTERCQTERAAVHSPVYVPRGSEN